jgi:hypothetical protein
VPLIPLLPSWVAPSGILPPVKPGAAADAVPEEIAPVEAPHPESVEEPEDASALDDELRVPLPLNMELVPSAPTPEVVEQAEPPAWSDGAGLSPPA